MLPRPQASEVEVDQRSAPSTDRCWAHEARPRDLSKVTSLPCFRKSALNPAVVVSPARVSCCFRIGARRFLVLLSG